MDPLAQIVPTQPKPADIVADRPSIAGQLIARRRSICALLESFKRYRGFDAARVARVNNGALERADWRVHDAITIGVSTTRGVECDTDALGKC